MLWLENMHHLLKICLVVLLALAPFSANTATAQSRPKSTTATQKSTPPKKSSSKPAAARKTTSDTRKKTQHVSGYTTKKGTKVAPYKRRPAN
jgi:hypothetical protein